MVSRFAVSRQTADFLLAGLEGVGVLGRGENNARVMDARFSRSDVVSILSNVDARGFERLFRKDGEGSYSHEPSMPEIEARTFPAESEGFVVSPLKG